MRIEAPAPDHVAAGRRDGHPAEAGKQRAGEQERGADAAAELLVELRLVDARRIDSDVVLGAQLDIGADVHEQLDHRLDVTDPRDVRQLHGLGCEGAGSQNREGAVLVPGGADRPAEGPPALDYEGLHSGG